MTPKKVNGWGPALEPLASYEINDAGCWIWTRSRNKDGYGQIAGVNVKSRRTSIKAHRWFYEHFKGPIPDGLEIDHLCCVKSCVNPDHLEAITHAENNRRAAKRITHCPKGHEYTPDNLRFDSKGRRRCRQCKAAHMRRWLANPVNAERAREAQRARRARARSDMAQAQETFGG